MENPATTLHCSNTRCQAPNPHSNKFCQQCRTPLLRRYLWALGQGIEAYKPGEAIAGRYLLVRQRILLDTKPGMPPETPQEIPRSLTPYLRLSPYGLNLPQVYGRATPVEGRRSPEIWLLEEAPIYTGGSLRETEAADVEGQLLPQLTSVWKDAPAVRQLNWLWQMATLWQPLSSEGVASSLLTPGLLRVEGSLVRLLELQPDASKAPTLKQLGQQWSQLVDGASPVIAEFFQQLCTQLREGQLRTSEQVVALLDQALQDGGRSLFRTYQIFTRSDAGPSRSQNEDACYPPSGQLISPSIGASALAIVCDGIGGHEGGEVASHLAIDTLRQRVEKLPLEPDNYNPTTLALELERAACAANDSISEQNDNEQRSDRQRMGTTLVMARTSGHEMYITHVGDSRVYWVTRHNCHQVTQDDDLASREVRLGYALYRYAVQQPTSGSLVQALGMAPSATLHPTVQRFVLDEDCIFLLCSDGLSDNDRVEQYWQTEILPILEGQIDLTTAGGRLIQIANTQNGHDNATIALVHCKVTSSQTKQPEVSVPQQTALPAPAATLLATPEAAQSSMKTQQLPSPNSARRPWGLLLGIFFLLGLGGVLAYVLIPGVNNWVDPMIGLGSNPTPEPLPVSPSPPPSPEPTPSAVASLEGRTFIQVIDSTTKNTEGTTVPLLLRRGLPPQNQSVVGIVPAGSILQILSQSPDQQQDTWVQLRVCSPGTASSNAQQSESVNASPASPQNQVGTTPGVPTPRPTSVIYREVKQGEGGWIREADVVPIIDPTFTPTSAQRSECATSPPAPASSTPRPTQSPDSSTPTPRPTQSS
jgi:serine/threonine protein phosphatase PrpC